MRLLTITCLLLLAANTFADTWYVKTDGNDDADGLSWANAWQTLEKTKTGMSGGDTCFFAPGVYRGQLWPIAGTAAAPTWYVSGNGTDNTIPTSYTGQRAGIWGSEDITGITFTESALTAESDQIWVGHYEPVDTVYRQEATSWVFAQYSETIDTLLVPHLVTGMPDTAGEFVYRPDVDSFYVCMFGGDNPNNYDTLEASWGPAVMLAGQSYVVIHGFDIRYSFQGGVFFAHHATDGSDSCLISHCNIRGVGQANTENAASVYSMYTGAVDTTCNPAENGWGNTVRACSLSLSVTPSMTTHRYGIGYYAQHAALVESCYVAPGMFYGIKFKSSCSWGTIRYNHVVMEGFTADEAGIQITVAVCGAQIYGNIVEGPATGTGSVGVSIQNQYSEDNTTWVSDISVTNNSFYNLEERGFQVDWSSPDTVWGDNYFKYNAFYNVADDAAWHGGIVSSPEHELQYWTIDSNIYYNVDETYNFLLGDSGNVDTAEWVDCGFDVNSQIDVDPGFDSVTAVDPWKGFARSGASNEMNLIYGDRTLPWTVFGAVQPDSIVPDTCPNPLLGVNTLYPPPDDGDTIIVVSSQDSIVMLSWSAITTGFSLRYRVEISEEPDFNPINITRWTNQPLFFAGGYGDDHLSDGFGTRHYWRVIVEYIGCGESDPSPVWSFVLVDNARPDPFCEN